MEQIITLFGNYAEEHPHYWISVSNKGYADGKETDDYVSASVPAYVTQKAKEYFEENSKETKNKDVDMLTARLKDGWLKAVVGKDQNYIVLVINELTPIEQKAEKRQVRRK